MMPTPCGADDQRNPAAARQHGGACRAVIPRRPGVFATDQEEGTRVRTISSLLRQGIDVRVLAAAATAAAAVVAAGLLLPSAASASSGSPLPTSSAGASFIATADPANGSVHVDSVSTGAVVHAAGAGASAKKGTGYACIVKTRKHAPLVGYKPLTVSTEGKSYENDWLLSPYSVTHARYLDVSHRKTFTFQVELCMTGSGHTWNSYHQWFNGGAIVLAYKKPYKIGQKWGTGVVHGAAVATLNFQLSKGAVTIGGSTQVKNYGTHGGDTGHDANLPVPKSWNRYDVNRVNAFYVSSHDWKWQGTSSDEGNVGHGLYEFDTGKTVNFAYGGATEIQAFCAKLIGSCAKFK